MFDINSVVIPKLSLAKRLNNALTYLTTHGGFPAGFKFVSRGDETAYLKIPGNPVGAICVHSEGKVENSIFFHPSLTGKLAWELSATTEGCIQLADDPDAEYIQFDTSIGGWEYHVIGICFSIIEERM